MWVWHFITCEKYLQDLIISLRGEIWVHKTRLTTKLFIEVPSLGQGSERSCICIDLLWFCYRILELEQLWYILFLILLVIKHTSYQKCYICMGDEKIYCITKRICSTVVLDTTQLLHRYKSNIGNKWQTWICQYSWVLYTLTSRFFGFLT